MCDVLRFQNTADLDKTGQRYKIFEYACSIKCIFFHFTNRKLSIINLSVK